MVRKLQEPQETEDWEKYRGRQSVPCCWEANAAKQRDWIARLKTFLADGSIEGSGTYPAYNGATVFAPDVRELAWAGFVWTGNFDTVGKQKKKKPPFFRPPTHLASFFQSAPTARSG